MTHESLVRAAESIRAAADAATGERIVGRLHEQADAIEGLADRNPDHGRMARHESKLHDLADGEGAAVADNVNEALSHIHAYRETVEGV
ncbi:hypothetical protein BRD00_08695 [Halobacteriales archaeon QS_8_69_26]|nr:MAG: hypothetical protein BRD00_08695 [Halobacteriales archaeon QS_8_69_26]